MSHPFMPNGPELLQSLQTAWAQAAEQWRADELDERIERYEHTVDQRCRVRTGSQEQIRHDGDDETRPHRVEDDGQEEDPKREPAHFKSIIDRVAYL